MAIHIDVLETAPHNYGSHGIYEGIGGHLFAFAGKISIEKGYGFVYFDAKTSLIEYYKKRPLPVKCYINNKFVVYITELQGVKGMLQKSLTNLQLEILKLYSTDMSEEELIELKKLLTENYANKAISEADKIWDHRGLSDSDMENWLHEQFSK